jgi:uroporphyrinogen decarboxylase
MKRNMREWAAGIIAGKERQVIPIMTYPGLHFTGKTIYDLSTNGEDHYKCIKALADNYPTAASVSVMDLSLEAQAFGADIIVSEDDVPTIKDNLLKDISDIAKLQVPKVGAGRTVEYIKAATLASKNITNKPVFAGMIGPFSLAGRLSDMSEFMVNVMIEPDASHELLKKCTSFLKEYAKAYKEAGCNGVVIAEPAAGLLSYETCHEFSSAYVKQIVDYVQDDNFIVILHNCGKTVELVPSMLSTGAAGFHFGNAVNMIDILPQIPADRFACGNVDPSGVFRGGNPESVKKTVKELLNKTKHYKNYILSSGCDVPPKTPKENVDAFFEALKEFNSGK